MAVTGRKRSSMRAKVAAKPTGKAALPFSQPISRTNRPYSPPSDSPFSSFASSKKDKQKIKHSSFVSRIQKSSSKTPKRRRPNKKLVATLESLADALPGLDENDSGENGNAGAVVVGQAKIQRKSLKSRPGAMKRKEKLEKMERDRFNNNLAQMAGAGATSSGSGGGNTIADRWAALKSHVQSTMEVKPEFVKK